MEHDQENAICKTIESFADDDELCRPGMGMPWCSDGLIQATNGHILIRVPEKIACNKNNYPHDGDNKPNTDSAVKAQAPWEPFALDAISAALEAVKDACPYCDGSGKLADCNPTDELKQTPTLTPFLGKYYSSHYLILIEKAMRVFSGQWEATPDTPSGSPLLFRNEQGITIGIMEMRKRSEWRG